MKATKPSTICRCAAFAVLFATCASPAPFLPAARAQTAPSNADLDADISALLEQLPSDNPATATQVLADLAQMGREGILDVASRIVPFEKGGDARARFVLNGMAMRAASSLTERALFTQTLSQLLANASFPDREFLLQQLGVAGGPEAIDAIGALLLDSQLYDDAARALQAMHGEASTRAAEKLRAVLPRAKGRNLAAIIQALGALRDNKSVVLIAPFAAVENADAAIRLPALFALSNIGNAASVDIVLGANSSSPYERGQETEAALVLARRLTQQNDARNAERILRHLQTTRSGEANRQVQTAVLFGLSQLPGASADAGLLNAMISPDAQIRAATINLVAGLHGEGVTKRWTARLQTSPAPQRAAILTMLGRRADSAALPAVLAATKDTNAATRAAAINAAGSFSDAKAATTLVALLGGKERNAAQTSLQRMPGAAATNVMANALATTSGATRRVLVETLALRGATSHVGKIVPLVGDADSGVRAAAWTAAGTLGDAKVRPALLRLLPKAQSETERQNAILALVAVSRNIKDENARVAPLIAAAKTASAPTRLVLLRALGRLGGSLALSPVQTAAKEKNPEIADAAVRVLADWPDASVLPALREVAKNGVKQTHRVLALRGYVRLVGAGSASPDEKLQLYASGMTLAARPEEKKLVLGGIGGVPSVRALLAAQSHLENGAVAEEAAVAVLNIARNASEDQIRNDANGDTTRAALRAILNASKNAAVRAQAQQLLETPLYAARVWQVVGPFPNADGNGGFDTVYEAERDALNDAVDVAKTYAIPNHNETVKWKAARSNNLGLLDFLPLMSRTDNALAYATITVESPNERVAIVSVGSDDGARVWLNGTEIISKNVPRSATRGEEQVPVQLRQGANQVLLKITQGGGGWEFYFDLLDPTTKKPLLDLNYAAAS